MPLAALALDLGRDLEMQGPGGAPAAAVGADTLAARSI